MIWAWMDTSSAETGSSQMIRLGSPARARAMPMPLPLAPAELVGIAPP